MSNTATKKEEKEVITIPTFNGHNYSNWSVTIQAYLEYKKLWYICEKEIEDLEAATDKVKGNNLETWLIFSSKIVPEVFNSLASTCGRNPYKIWHRIKENYAAANIYGIYRVWVNYSRITYDDDLLKYIMKLEAALAEISTIGVNVMQELVSVTIMEKITEKRPALMERLLGDIDTLKNPFLLIAKLRQIANHDQVKKIKDGGHSTALATSTSNKKRPYVSCKGGKHNPDAPHDESRCWTLHPELRNTNKKAANYATTTAQSRDAADGQAEQYAYNTSCTSSGKESVILDSGASQHMFNSLKYFVDSEPTVIYIVTGSGRENASLMATRKGTARLMMRDSTIITLTDSLYVPNLATNLVSFAQLIKEKADIVAESGMMMITLNGCHTVCVDTSKNLFELVGLKTEHHTALTVTTRTENVFDKWHKRMGHASAARVQAAIDENIPKSMTTCDTCQRGKMTKLPFKGYFNPAEKSMDIIHGDLVGPISPATNGGARYFLTLVDQHTGFININLLAEKADATKAIVEYRTYFEKQTGNPIKKIVTDGGGEFCNKVLGDILKEAGIQHNVSPPYTPQHNGIAERANRTIIEMTRCLMLQANMAAEWWGEAVVTAASTTNCLPSLAKSRASPLQLLLKIKPNPHALRPFGCRAWALKPKVNREEKFDSIAWDGTFVGYTNDMSSYRIFRHVDQKIIHTRQVQFDESVFPHCKALCKSLGVAPRREDDSLPIFQSDSILPYDEEEQVDSSHNLPEEQQGENSQEPSSEELPSGRRWVYVEDFQPEKHIESNINAQNIIQGGRTRRQACFMTSIIDPKSHNMAMSSPERQHWIEAELKEVNNMRKHQVWIERLRVPADRPIASTWAYRRKLGPDNQVIKYKARICAQGFRQTYGVNFELKYAPTGKAASLRLLLSFAVNSSLQIHQLDVRSAFLTCPLQDTVTLLPPQGYRCPNGTVFELRKAIYGLKQASLVWYKRLSEFLETIGFRASTSDPCVFSRPELQGKPATWIYAHVDDLVIISSDPLVLKTEFEHEFDIKYLGAAEFLLGMNIDRTATGLHVHQMQYIERKLIEYGLDQSPPASCPLNPKGHLKKATEAERCELVNLGINYRAIVGSLNYLSVLTRPDISHAVSVLSQHLEAPVIQHLRAAEQVFRYLSGTKQVGLVFTKAPSLAISAYVDSDWGNCPDTRRSATGFVILTGDQVLSWKATRQATVSLSSTEAEYKALSDLGREITWLTNLISELSLNYSPSNIPVNVDNQGAIDLARSEISQNGFRTKHMDIRLHFVRELITSKLIKLRYVRTDRNCADFLTKPTGRATIRRSLSAINVTAPETSASRLRTQSNPACQIISPVTDLAVKRSRGNTSYLARQGKPLGFIGRKQ
jgi:transposase InsO family protein